MGIDKKDEKILALLMKNSRLSYGKIAKKVYLSKSNVKYRIEKLLEKGIIEYFYILIDFSNLGYTQYKVYLKLENITPLKEKEIISFLKKENNIVWVVKCLGKWDITFSGFFSTPEEIGYVLDNLVSKFSQYILEKDVLVTRLSNMYNKKTVLGTKDTKMNYGIGKPKYILDNIEFKILSSISISARKSIEEIAKEIGFSRDIVQYRLKKLEKEKIIRQYSCILNLSKLDLRLYKILLRLRQQSAKNEFELQKYLANHKEGTQYLKLLGNWDYELEFEVSSEKRIYEILQDLKNKFSEQIKDYDVLGIYEQYKFDFFPFS